MRASKSLDSLTENLLAKLKNGLACALAGSALLLGSGCATQRGHGGLSGDTDYSLTEHDYRGNPVSTYYNIPEGTDLTRCGLMRAPSPHSMQPFIYNLESFTLHVDYKTPTNSSASQNGVPVQELDIPILMHTPAPPAKEGEVLLPGYAVGSLNIRFREGYAKGWLNHSDKEFINLGGYGRLAINNITYQTISFLNVQLSESANRPKTLISFYRGDKRRESKYKERPCGLGNNYTEIRLDSEGDCARFDSNGVVFLRD